MISRCLRLFPLPALLLSVPASAVTTLREAQHARRAAYHEHVARHEQQEAEAKLREAVKAHAPWRKHIRRLHQDLRLFYGRTGSDLLFLCDANGITQKVSEEDFDNNALEIDMPDFDSDFSALDGSDRDVRVKELYPYSLTFRCRRVLEVSPERLRLLATPVEHAMEDDSLGTAELIILHPTPQQMEMAKGDKIREYFTRALTPDGSPAVSSASRYDCYPVLKTYNTLKDDTRRPNARSKKQKR